MQLDFAKEGDESVTQRIVDMEERLAQTKLELSYIIISCFVDPAYINEVVRRETTKKHEQAVKVEPNDILFCKKLYAKTLSFTQALVRVKELGASNQVALLQKVGKSKRQNFITRSLDTLFFIAKHDQELIGAKTWLPNFNICQELKNLEQRRGYVKFEDAPIPVGWESTSWEEGGEEETGVKDLPPVIPEDEEDHQREAEEPGTADFTTRKGRRTKKPVKYTE